MNTDQIQALIADFEARAAEAARSGNQQGEHYYAVAADIVREHQADALRARPPALAQSVRVPV